MEAVAGACEEVKRVCKKVSGGGAMDVCSLLKRAGWGPSQQGE